MPSHRTRTYLLITVVAALFALVAGPASAATKAPKVPTYPGVNMTPPKGPIEDAGATPAPGAQRMTFTVGPLTVTPGQNKIKNQLLNTEKPSVNGYITRFKPNLVYADGTVPKTNLVMFHHGVWINLSRKDSTTGGLGGERLFATGEEKTITAFPNGYGYRYKKSDTWLLNNMIHNLTPDPMTLYITYEIDFIPDTAPEAASITPVRPIWLDVQNGSIYPVFDVHKGSGGKDGKFVYPNDDPDAYPAGVQKNEWTADRDGVLIATAGHVHTGGLSTDLWMRRAGASYAGPNCSRMVKGAKRTKCVRRAPKVQGDTVHLFKSEAKYWEPAGPVSWDVAMTGTKPGWRVAVHKGDTLGINTTYETKLASWYESMGIMVVYMADTPSTPTYGKDPFSAKVDWPGFVSHGHLAENSVHGGGKTDLPDAANLPDGPVVTTDASLADPYQIADFTYEQGDLRFAAPASRPPVVHRGQSITFELGAGDHAKEQWHSVTSCKAPCNASTGIAYPIADGKYQFDSGQLGTGGPPTVERTTWSTPTDLPTGTYTYFCRIHPLMRGSFRVEK